MDLARFGRYLVRLRELRGYKTRKDLAEDAGINPATLSRIEAGKHKVEPETLKKLAPFLDVSYSKLMIAAGYMPGNINEDDGGLNFIVPVRAERMIEVLAHARGLNDEDYNMITDQVERLVMYAQQQKKRKTAKPRSEEEDDN